MCVNPAIIHVMVSGVTVCLIICPVRNLGSHYFRTETMIDVSGTKLDMMYGRGVVIKVYLIVPVVNAGAVIGRIPVGKGFVIAESILIARICVNVE